MPRYLGGDSFFGVLKCIGGGEPICAGGGDLPGVLIISGVNDMPRYPGCDGVFGVLKCAGGGELKCAGGGVLAGDSTIEGVEDMPRYSEWDDVFGAPKYVGGGVIVVVSIVREVDGAPKSPGWKNVSDASDCGEDDSLSGILAIS